MTVKKLETLADLIVEAEQRYDRVADDRTTKSNYYLGRLRGLQDAAKCDRLTPAEHAVIDAALAMTGPRSPGLAWALGALREERGLEAPTGERKVSSLDTRRTAGKVVADGYSASSCDDCGSDLHSTDSVYCPVRQQDDDGRD